MLHPEGSGARVAEEDRPMKGLKFGVALLGVIGIVAVFLPALARVESSFSFFATRALDSAHVYLVLGGLAVATAMGILGIIKPPFERWQAGIALAGFATAAIKLQVWQLAKHFGAYLIGMKLLTLVPVIGAIVALLAVILSEED
jgi:hypothetical protein